MWRKRNWMKAPRSVVFSALVSKAPRPTPSWSPSPPSCPNARTQSGAYSIQGEGGTGAWEGGLGAFDVLPISLCASAPWGEKTLFYLFVYLNGKEGEERAPVFPVQTKYSVPEIDSFIKICLQSWTQHRRSWAESMGICRGRDTMGTETSQVNGYQATHLNISLVYDGGNANKKFV